MRSRRYLWLCVGRRESVRVVAIADAARSASVPWIGDRSDSEFKYRNKSWKSTNLTPRVDFSSFTIRLLTGGLNSLASCGLVN